MIELQSSRDVFIPRELSLMKLPLSFRYYDPVLQIIKQMMPQEVQEIHGLQKNMIELFKGKFKKQVLKSFGIITDPNENNDGLNIRTPRARFENPIKNQINNFYISHTASKYVMGL